MQVAQLASKVRRGEVAPDSIIECVKAACRLPFGEGRKVERSLFEQLSRGYQARALQHMFFAERMSSRVESFPSNIRPKQIDSVGIVGAGLMGGGIAMCAANVGIPVRLLDVSEEALQKGLSVIRKNYERSVSRGKLTKAQMEKALMLISPTQHYDDFKNVDLVIEAVFEDMELKRQVFSSLDSVCRPGCVLCTNTSALDIDEIASATSRPSEVMGMHFFSPANVMKLLENVRGKYTSMETVATAMALGKRLQKITALVGNCPGFVGNRMIAFYSNEANRMILEGALPAQVDLVAREFGMPMGPFQMADLVGLDLHWRVLKAKGMSNPQQNVRDALCEAGRLGQKTKLGYYSYDDSRKPSVDATVTSLIVKISSNLGIQRRAFTADEIKQRLWYPLINEGFTILEEGIAQRPSDIDVIHCYGYGFPRYRGGPMHYADEIGLPNIKAGLEEFGYRPAPLLKRCVEEGCSLDSYWKRSHRIRMAPKL